jgi:Domain of Unknown Function (DUF1206)
VQISAVTESSPEQSNALELLSRAGYAAKGVVYATVGVLVLGALYSAFGNEGLTGTKGAVNTIADQPFGNALLAILIIGLAGYVVWRLMQGLRDTEGKGDDASGWMQRIGFIISAIFYSSLTWYAIKVAGWFGSGGSASANGSSHQQAWTAKLMSYEAGIWAVGVAGAVFVGVAVYQFYRAISRKFEKNWKTNEIPHQQLSFARRFAQFGIVARSITFAITGGLLVQAAMHANPDDAQGLGHALQSLQDETYGTALLTVIGLGLVCYGIYCFVNARYRHVNV